LDDEHGARVEGRRRRRRGRRSRKRCLGV